MRMVSRFFFIRCLDFEVVEGSLEYVDIVCVPLHGYLAETRVQSRLLLEWRIHQQWIGIGCIQIKVGRKVVLSETLMRVRVPGRQYGITKGISLEGGGGNTLHEEG